MKAKRILFLSILAVLSTGCFLFVAESRFYIQNNSAAAVTVEWVLEYDGSRVVFPEQIQPGETALIVTGKILEANELLPSMYFRSLTISGTTFDPVDDRLWQRTERSRNRDDFTLFLN